MKKVLYFFEQPKNPWLSLIFLIAIGTVTNNIFLLPVIISYCCADIYENIKRKSALDYVSKRWLETDINEKNNTNISIEQVNETALEMMENDGKMKVHFWWIWAYSYTASYFLCLLLNHYFVK